MTAKPEIYFAAKAGQIIFNAGDSGLEMYLIESGEVQVFRGKLTDEPLATLGAGDFFGEMSILEDEPRFATVVCKSDAKLVRIDRASFVNLLNQNAEISIRIMRKLANRLRRCQQSLDAHEASSIVQTSAKPVAHSELLAQAPVSVSRADVKFPIYAFRHVGSDHILTFPAQEELLIGRPDPVTGINPEVNLGALDVQRTLSRRHAKLHISGLSVTLTEEVGTTNGTFVNGARLSPGKPVQIKVGDELCFGSVHVELISPKS